MNTDKSLRTQLLEIGIPESDISSYCSDLHLIYSKEREQWLKENYKYWCNIQIHRANVEGHKWHGKRFFDIPFAYIEHYQHG